MVHIGALWLPIVLSAVGVFITSFILWAVLPYHRSDYRAVANEDAARRALANLPPGLYNIPNVPNRDALKEPEYAKKFADGPNAFLTVLPNGVPSTGKSMAQWIVFLLAVSGAVGYVASRALPPEAEFLEVLQVVGIVAWLGYGAGAVQDAVWFGKPWLHIGKHLFDALLFALLSAGIFWWLWPGM